MSQGKRRARISRASFPVVIAALAMLISTAPLAAASAVVTRTPPYTGATKIQSISTSSGGNRVCSSSLSVGTAGAFNIISGKATENVTVRAGCSNFFGSKSGSASGAYDSGLGLKGLPFVLSSSGNYDLAAKWNVSYSVSLIANPGVGVSVSTQVKIFVVAYLIDLTTGKAVKGPHPSISVFNKGLASGSFMTSVSGVLFFPGFSSVALVSGDIYEFYSVIKIDITAQATMSCSASSCRGSSSASVSLTNPPGDRLVSLKIG